MPEGQAGAFDCKKGASEAMGRFFVSGKYLVGLISLKSLEAVGTERKSQGPSFREKNRHQRKLFSKLIYSVSNLNAE